MPWVTLRRAKQLRQAGVSKNYLPGDSVEVGRQTAINWVLDGSAKDPFGQVGPPVIPEGLPSGKFGVRIRSAGSRKVLQRLGTVAHRVKVSYGPPVIPYEHTLIWRPDRRISEELVNYGYVTILSDRQPVSWELAACLVGTSQLASDLGSKEEREKTRRVVGDLRLPVYETRAIWAQKCPAAEAVIAEWAKELAEGADEYHAFLRALYTKRAMLCTLPYDWTSQ